MSSRPESSRGVKCSDLRVCIDQERLVCPRCVGFRTAWGIFGASLLVRSLRQSPTMTLGKALDNGSPLLLAPRLRLVGWRLRFL